MGLHDHRRFCGLAPISFAFVRGTVLAPALPVNGAVIVSRLSIPHSNRNMSRMGCLCSDPDDFGLGWGGHRGASGRVNVNVDL